ncbi:hypothetical protein KKF61_07710 [Patescibacteria group bacterium]|nr:hypothetical protein [Patescibacteria group bacterium]
MTAEGIFPKVDGDILHASEVNQMYDISNPFWSKYTVGSYVYKTETNGTVNVGSLVFTNISGVSTININYIFDLKNWSSSSDASLYQCGSPTGEIIKTYPGGNFPNGFRCNQFTAPIKENSIYNIIYSLGPEGAGSIWIKDIYIWGGVSGIIVDSSF